MTCARIFVLFKLVVLCGLLNAQQVKSDFVEAEIQISKSESVSYAFRAPHSSANSRLGSSEATKLAAGLIAFGDLDALGTSEEFTSARLENLEIRIAHEAWTKDPAKVGVFLRSLRLRHRVQGSRWTLVDATIDSELVDLWLGHFPYEFSHVFLHRRTLPPEAERAPAPALHNLVVNLDRFVMVDSMSALEARIDQKASDPTVLGPRQWRVATRQGLKRISLALRHRETDALHRVLDDFHRFASVAHGENYFGAFASHGVFLGTDASERWTAKAFRSWGAKYFKGESAWIFVPQKRFITHHGKSLASFDEVLGSRSYGECRGSGVLVKEDGQWKVAQYNLTTPVPNALLLDVVRRTRSLLTKSERAEATTVILMRHAEKAKDGTRNPPLTPKGKRRADALVGLLESSPVDAVISSPYKRTKETVAPLAKARGLTALALPPFPAKPLADRIMTEFLGKTVVVAGHSNTVPALIKALGVKDAPKIGEDDYHDLFIVTVTDSGAQLLALKRPLMAAPTR